MPEAAQARSHEAGAARSSCVRRMLQDHAVMLFEKAYQALG